jgi:hypothetical protein
MGGEPAFLPTPTTGVVNNDGYLPTLPEEVVMEEAVEFVCVCDLGTE